MKLPSSSPPFFPSVIPSLFRRQSRRWQNVILSERSEVEKSSRDQFGLPFFGETGLILRLRGAPLRMTALLIVCLLAALPSTWADAPTPPASHPPKAEYTTTDAVFCLAYSPDGTKLACGVKDNTIKLWDVTTGQLTTIFTGHENPVMGVSWSPDGNTLASASMDGTIKLWSVVTGQCRSTLTGHTDFVWSVSFSHNGQRLASGSSDKTIKVWSAGTGQCLATLTGHGGTVNGIVWSPDDQTLASSSSDNSVKLWDVASGHCTATLEGHLDEVTSVSFSPDGKTLASSSRDNSIKLWNVATGQCTATLNGHTGPVYRVSFSPDGKSLASGSADKTIRLWDATTGQCTGTLAGHDGAVSGVCWSPDGSTLASGGRDKSIKLWAVNASSIQSAPTSPAPPSTTPPAMASTSASPAANSVLNNPWGVAVDRAGNLYISDNNNFVIRKMTPDGKMTILAGSVGVEGLQDGIGSAAQFLNPRGLAVDGSGNVFVADAQTIREITPDGVVTTLAGEEHGKDETGQPPQIVGVGNVAVDGSGNIYFSDNTNTIRKISPSGLVTTIAGVMNKKGYLDGPGGTALFKNPAGVAVDGAGNVYVADTLNAVIRKITPAGIVSTFAGCAGQREVLDGIGSAAHFHSPIGLTIDGVGNLYVGECLDGNIRKITPDGVVTTLAGYYGIGGGGFKDGTGQDARFGNIEGVAVDSSGNVYVADRGQHPHDKGNNAIRKITPAGVVTTLIGTPPPAQP